MLGVFRTPLSTDRVNAVDLGPCALGTAAQATPESTSAGVCGVIDGRLDNAFDLQRMLGIDSAVSDARLVVAAYERFGIRSFRYLSGDFAVIVWDARSQQIIAARDLFAVRPLCFVSRNGWFAVASDPEQMLAARLSSAEADDDMVVDYLLWDARFVDRTFFRDIHAVAPGQFVLASRTGHQVASYQPTALRTVHLSSRDEYYEEYRRRFRAAVQKRIRSESPVIAELSGGLDSSSIVCTADRLLAEDSSLCPAMVAASALYPGLPCDEEKFVFEVRKQIRFPVRDWNGTIGVSDELDRSSRALPGGRFGNFGGTDGHVDIAREIGARVLISGLGGDQVGTPSGALRDAVTAGRWTTAVRMILDTPGRTPSGVIWSLTTLARSFSPAWLRNFRALFPRNRLDVPWVRSQLRSRRRVRSQAEAPVLLKSEVARRIWRLLSSGGHVRTMAYAQHHAMRSGLDARFPFLDVDLIALILSVPSQFWPPGWAGERLHRSILAKDLPGQVVARRNKADFTPALTLRVRRHLPWIRDTFASSNWRAEKYVDRHAVGELLKEFESQQHPKLSVSYALWTISAVEAWLRANSGYSRDENGLAYN